MWERMGSGGLRGLQILRSGVQSVRGGFDSHAFPPLFGLALLVVLSGVAFRECGAQTPERLAPDSTARADTSRGRIVTVGERSSRADSAARARAVKQKLLDQPRFVMMRSLLIPGWGQLHNRAWIKAVLVAGGEGWLVTRLIEDDRALRDLDAEVVAARALDDLTAENQAVDRYNARLDRYVGRQWLLGGLLVYALMDAYVDAHFVNFKIQFENDPARPAGARLGLEKRF
jgi:hypothetical protein